MITDRVANKIIAAAGWAGTKTGPVLFTAIPLALIYIGVFQQELAGTFLWSIGAGWLFVRFLDWADERIKVILQDNGDEP